MVVFMVDSALTIQKHDLHSLPKDSRHSQGAESAVVLEPIMEPTELAHSDPLTTPYSECFHWDRLADWLPLEEGQPLYAVVFRSVRKEEADTQELYEADAAAHEEARAGGGLLTYWYGVLNERRECLATCIWSSRDAARRALGQPKHANAMRLASRMYHTYELTRYWVYRSKPGADGEGAARNGLRFEPVLG